VRLMSALDNRADRVAQVQAQVAYHGQRLVLYQRLHGSSPSARLSELEHAYNSARERLAGATDGPPDPGTRLQSRQ
jgi:hypothetical protein